MDGKRILAALVLAAVAVALVITAIVANEPRGELLYVAAFLIGVGLGSLRKRWLLGAIIGGVIAVAVFHVAMVAFIIHGLANAPK
jgi:hypothetical protein